MFKLLDSIDRPLNAPSCTCKEVKTEFLELPLADDYVIEIQKLKCDEF